MQTIKQIYRAADMERCMFDLATELSEAKRQRPQLKVNITIQYDSRPTRYNIDRGYFIRPIIADPRQALIGELCLVRPSYENVTVAEYNIGSNYYHDTYRVAPSELIEKCWFLSERVKKSQTSYWSQYNKPVD